MQKQIAELQSKVQAKAGPAKRIKPSLALKTPAGKRAVTVMVDSLAAVGGLLNPGDSVDVIAQLSVPTGSNPDKSERKNQVTAMIFQGLQVLAVNTNLDETGAYYDDQQAANAIRVTVAVDPQEAGLLSFANKNGKLELALRSNEDTEHQMVKASTWKTLADYVLENQGADIDLPSSLKGDGAQATQTTDKPSIQIFRGGKEL
jgi:Flp pilus assembly protein CpaB